MQLLALCQRAGLVRLGQVAIDGTILAANAGKHRNLDYRTLSEREQEWAELVAQLLEEARRSDESEDSRHGSGQRGDELPENLRTASAQLEKIRAAKHELKREARQRAAEVGQERESQKGKSRDEAQRKRWQRNKRERLATAEGKSDYRQRQATVEPVFGWIKSILGYRRFLLRGLKKAQGEWSLICAALNLSRLHRLQAMAAGK